MRSDCVVIGGGIVGCATAYYLGKAGVRATIIERDSVAEHASGMALGGLNPLGGVGIPGPVAPLALESFWLHKSLAAALREEAGMDTQFHLLPVLTVAFTEEEAAQLRAHLPWLQGQEGFRVEWKSGDEVRALEPRLSPRVAGGIVTHLVGLLDPYRHALALLKAAEHMGATMRHGTVRGLRFRGDRVAGVALGREVVPCGAVVIAMGPWTAGASSWLGLELPVEPLKGEILRLQVKGPPVQYVAWGHTYAVSKPDGLVWAGTTEEQAGFDATSSHAARLTILRNLLEGLPSLKDASVVMQTACLRPVTPDGLPYLGQVPGRQGVVVATGAGRKGILLGPLMGRIAAELVVHGRTDYDITALAPGRPVYAIAPAQDPLRF